jgi:hypothetical protein
MVLGENALVRTFTAITLKVLTNEKKDGLKAVSFERSCFKLFTLKFSKS